MYPFSAVNVNSLRITAGSLTNNIKPRWAAIYIQKRSLYSLRYLNEYRYNLSFITWCIFINFCLTLVSRIYRMLGVHISPFYYVAHIIGVVIIIISTYY